jgi:hypothetical protein
MSQQSYYQHQEMTREKPIFLPHWGSGLTLGWTGSEALKRKGIVKESEIVTVSFGDMIACDNEEAGGLWYSVKEGSGFITSVLA